MPPATWRCVVYVLLIVCRINEYCKEFTMITLRSALIILAVTVLIASAMVLLALERPAKIVAATNMPEALTAFVSSRAWVTSYDDEGGLSDITTVTCGSVPGYQTALSDYVGAVVNRTDDSYVLNWRPYNLGRDMQLCGLRVAYRLPLEGGGFDSSFSYYHVAGSALRPRTSDVEWSRDGSGGCLYATDGDPTRIFNINMSIPDGSRIDYLRIYCFRETQVFLPAALRNY
jgi:hypothetical protein